MNTDEKKAYIVKLLISIWLIPEKIYQVAIDLDKKEENILDEIIIKLESSYATKKTIDKNYINKLDKINNQIDESIEISVENFHLEKSFNF